MQGELPRAQQRAPPVLEDHPCSAGQQTELQVLALGRRDQAFAAPDEVAVGVRGHRLEYVIGACLALAALLWTWATWRMAGRVLRPVAAIRRKVSQITEKDLSPRVPEPPGHDEIAQLARAANRTLDRLETAVRHQRQFASLVAHELRTPLTGLRAGLEEALLYPRESDFQETIENSLVIADRLQGITDDLLVFTRIRDAPVTLEPVDLGALVTDEAGARHGFVPVHARAQHGVMVHGNRIQLIGVLTNLLVNAQRHAESAVEVTAERSGGQAVVTVLDDSDGVAPEDRERGGSGR
ncbi:hypothetical protein Misp01_22470 [Microtetraspora sp. NBRC 13810]|uniref:histidine kinase dimerization/phospho-acceptor domain-containing protein n=1 Tax=Microtetraspora sp. NBRC 13810 TaxID=3030990 RepID=UPI0024A21F4D|nr:histidine kinase dimerization/phospho-acceptor domain-containing protein [Microtetraspora sp. NBRC 13810]GLW07117.1 hypothetical protein Misp01_22470 [Microtetraspora sp. NBRC 13810]